jgi:hypothetical protein
MAMLVALLFVACPAEATAAATDRPRGQKVRSQLDA